MMRFYLFVIIMVIILNGCNNKTSSGKLDFPLTMQREIIPEMAKGKVIVYYHSGDCSICYGTLMAITKEFPGLPLISISASENKVLVDYYLEQIGFRSISFIDSTSLFLNKNRNALGKQNLFLIDFQYNIITGGENFDENTKEKINRAIR